MFGQEQTQQAPRNVLESAALYDTLQIKYGIKDLEGFASFLALSAQTEIPFFTVRNRSEVGEAITNKDSKDSMPWPFHAYSMGIQFFAPNPIKPPYIANGSATDLDIASQSIGWLFGKVAPLHCGVILRVREDDKLIHTAELMPAGSGAFGGMGNYSGIPNVGSNGWPSLGNRWKFPDPVSIPRGAVVEAKLRFTTYGRALLAALPGPGTDNLGPFTEQGAGVAFPQNALIRVSLIGKREVQQRGELHY